MFITTFTLFQNDKFLRKLSYLVTSSYEISAKNVLVKLFYVNYLKVILKNLSTRLMIVFFQ